MSSKTKVPCISKDITRLPGYAAYTKIYLEEGAFHIKITPAGTDDGFHPEDHGSERDTCALL